MNEFSSSFSTQEDSSDISSIPCFSNICPTEFASGTDDFLQPTLSVEDFLQNPTFGGEMEFIYGKLNDSEISNEFQNGWSPSPSIKSSSEASMATPPSLILPEQEFELDILISVLHLLKAYGEAIENEQTDLANVIMTCLSEKVTLCGEPLLRLAFNFSSQQNQHQKYLKQEAYKNFETAFKAFYQIFLYGRFSHFAANSVIVKAMPADAEIIHIVDFDIGEGVQWPPLLEVLAMLGKEVKLTTIKWEKCDQTPLMWNFEEAKRRLVDYAKDLGLRLKMEEIGIEELVNEIKKRRKRGSTKEWLVFNCMVGLPHMGRVRSRKLVKEFLSVAKELLMGSNNNKGVITFGDGDFCESSKTSIGFGSFFEGNMVKYQALLESIEYNFPIHLGDGRMALECLFVGPYVSSHVWLQRWMEIKEGCCDFEMGSCFEGCRISRESMEEAQEMVKRNESFYGVRVGGEWNNEMILEWKGTPLLRFSAWRN
ncbi:hypothetical protein JCGZ_00433 [Jatropha curcas]|uniref:GRAS46 protein n=2 Tax=Jatropha curcas TaxID=180498 RepID=A0A067JG06_JATCU|nr:GRAS46 protein [Jatropha curcas]KDP22846.1 hypothetical protein JCGZ_00433 [Jatropha curcas]